MNDFLMSSLCSSEPSSRPPTSQQPSSNTPQWLARELLHRCDTASGEICLFHYPTVFFPSFSTIEMHEAFQLVLRVGSYRGIVGRGAMDGAENSAAGQEDDGIESGEVAAVNSGAAGASPTSSPATLEMGISQWAAHNATEESRGSITGIYFSWYQFPALPSDIVGATFLNLQHVDIRQNASLTCIESIITQLPNLTSLNISDCPNVRTLAPFATVFPPNGNDDEDVNATIVTTTTTPRRLNLRHLWVRGCNLSTMTHEVWNQVFKSLSKSVGPLERLTLSRNNMSFLSSGIGNLKYLTYLFVEDNNNVDIIHNGFTLPAELGSLSSLQYASFSGNNLHRLPRTLGRLPANCDVLFHRNPRLTYPPPSHRQSIQSIKAFFHNERMTLLRGITLCIPHLERMKVRANERLYSPGGLGYSICKHRFQEMAARGD